MDEQRRRFLAQLAVENGLPPHLARALAREEIVGNPFLQKELRRELGLRILGL